MVSRLGLAYFGGAVAALVSSAALWMAGQAELLAMLGVKAPVFTWDWMAPRLLWGSLWGLGFPLVRRRGLSPVRTGLALSLAPTLADLLIFMPMHNQRLFGTALGTLTPLVVLIGNALWGWALTRIMVSTGHS